MDVATETRELIILRHSVRLTCHRRSYKKLPTDRTKQLVAVLSPGRLPAGGPSQDEQKC